MLDNGYQRENLNGGQQCGPSPIPSGVVDRLGDRTAKIISSVFDPPWVAIALLAVVTANSTAHLLQFLQWWLLSALFLVFIPLAVILFAVRRGRLSDRSAPRAPERVLPFAACMASAAVGALLLILLAAPREVLAVTLGGLVGVLVALPMTARFKLSIHVASVAGAVLILTLTLGAWSLALTPLIPLVGWARLVTNHHTVAEVAIGALIGAAVGAGVFTAIVGLA